MSALALSGHPHDGSRLSAFGGKADIPKLLTLIICDGELLQCDHDVSHFGIVNGERSNFPLS
jgi:hypothetical protein